MIKLNRLLLIFFSFFLITNFQAQTELWGITANGGKYNRGTIFKTNGSADNFSLEYDWFIIDAEKLGSNVIELNGKLYGVSREGGRNNKGIIFDYDTTSKHFTKRFDFDGAQNGSSPIGSLTKGPDGMLYGLTFDGGAFNQGVLFQFNPITDNFVKKMDFYGSIGAQPTGNLLLLGNGKLYGLTTAGGSNGVGVLFEFDVATNVYSVKLSCNGSTGSNPRGELLLASDGKLYGLASYGGAYTYGTLFQYDLSSNVSVIKVNFTGAGVSGNGSSPQASLIQAPDGMIYGTTSNGGSANKGTLFQYNPFTNVCTKKIDFTGSANGSYPLGSLVLGANGKLYGMASQGGVNGKGVLFQYDFGSSSILKIFDFDINDNNLHPKATLIQGTNGLLYGTVYRGLFSYNVTSSTFKYEFKTWAADTGATSGTSFIKATNGKLYGLTSTGGVYGSGVIFQYDYYSHVCTKVSDFNNVNGRGPRGKLLEATNGKLYGMTQYGGQIDKGVIFEYDITADTCIKLYDFNGINGSEPYGSLLEISGVLYGMTNRGGTTDKGVMFKYNISSNTFTKLLDFSSTIGASPIGSLIYASNGLIYGTTTYGGASDYGVIFQFNPTTEVYTKKFNFSLVNGTYPSGSLLQANDGMLYGLANGGGTNSKGVLFQYYPDSNQYVRKYNFNLTNGQNPSGTLIQASNGKLYGTAPAGVPFSSGVLFEYDPLNGVLIKKKDFSSYIDGACGGYPELLEIPVLETIVTKPVISPACILGTMNVSYAITGTYNSGNVFTVQLSDSLGTFTSPVIIGSVLSVTAGIIAATIPSSVIGADGYRMRVVSSNPIVVGMDNGTDLKINPIPNMFILPPTIPCSGSSTSLMSSGADLYQWSTGAYTSTCSVIPLLASEVYTVTGTNLTGCVNSQTVNVSVDNTCSDVWPGDANSDGIANNIDVLELGLHYFLAGSTRTSVSNNWQPYFANGWTGMLSNGKNLNHSDCNGDGIIDNNDTLAIYNNYSLTHSFKTAETNTVNPQLRIVPDQPGVVKGTWGTASVYLGESTNPINNINGLAFTINFGNTLIETNSIYIEYQNSFLDAGQNLDFRKLDFANGKIFTATTHTVNNNVSGYGKIATLHYQIKSSLTTDQVLNLGISQANQSDASGVITPLTSGTSTLMALGAGVGLQELNGHLISISPNPTNGSLTINSKTELQKIEIVSITGQVLVSEFPTNVSHTLHLESLSNGIYFVNIYQNDRIVKREKIVLNK